MSAGSFRTHTSTELDHRTRPGTACTCIKAAGAAEQEVQLQGVQARQGCGGWHCHIDLQVSRLGQHLQLVPAHAETTMCKRRGYPLIVQAGRLADGQQCSPALRGGSKRLVLSTRCCGVGDTIRTTVKDACAAEGRAHLGPEHGHDQRGAAQVGVQLLLEGQPLRLPRQLLQGGKHLAGPSRKSEHLEVGVVDTTPCLLSACFSSSYACDCS